MMVAANADQKNGMNNSRMRIFLFICIKNMHIKIPLYVYTNDSYQWR